MPLRLNFGRGMSMSFGRMGMGGGRAGPMGLAIGGIIAIAVLVAVLKA